jgi:hypothetical protein
MSGIRTVGAAAATLLLAIAAFQIALAAGAPLGFMAWGGGQDDVLPAGYRLASAASAVVLVVAALIVLARAGFDTPWPQPAGWLGVACWVIAVFMAFNTFTNLASKSNWERFTFGPATIALVVLSIILARSGPGGR